MSIKTATDILEIANAKGIAISEVMAIYEEEHFGTKRSEIYEAMAKLWKTMEKSAKEAYEEPSRIELLITKNDSYKMFTSFSSNGSHFGDMYFRAMQHALSVSCVNASMGRVSACPTGGSCGVVPGCLYAAKEQNGFSDESLAKALLTASGVGLAIVENATFAGALGGCQAEIGSAAAMASAALCELYGANPNVCFEAAAISIKSLMGLICDPVASLVESPCAKRNATAACIALGSAEMALAGIQSIIPFDECVSAMKSVAQKMPLEHRETSEGGLAATTTALKLTKDVFGENK